MIHVKIAGDEYENVVSNNIHCMSIPIDDANDPNAISLSYCFGKKHIVTLNKITTANES